jgi:hypothetical protein
MDRELQVSGVGNPLTIGVASVDGHLVLVCQKRQYLGRHSLLTGLRAPAADFIFLHRTWYLVLHSFFRNPSLRSCSHPHCHGWRDRQNFENTNCDH